MLSEHGKHTIHWLGSHRHRRNLVPRYRRGKGVGCCQSTNGSDDTRAHTHTHSDNPRPARRLSDGCRPLLVIHFPPFRKWGRDLFIIIHHHSIIIIIMIVMMIAFIILIIIITISTVMAVIYLVFMAHSETVTYIVNSDSCLIQGPTPSPLQSSR